MTETNIMTKRERGKNTAKKKLKVKVKVKNEK